MEGLLLQLDQYSTTSLANEELLFISSESSSYSATSLANEHLTNQSPNIASIYKNFALSNQMNITKLIWPTSIVYQQRFKGSHRVGRNGFPMKPPRSFLRNLPVELANIFMPEIISRP